MFEIVKLIENESWIYRYFSKTFCVENEHITHIATDGDGVIWAYFLEPIFDWNTLTWEYEEDDPNVCKRHIKLGKCEFVGNPYKSLVSYVH